MRRTLFKNDKGNAAVFGLPAAFDILERIKGARSIRLATDYGKLTGWELLEKSVEMSRASVYLMAGLGFGLTEPRLLRRWLKLSDGASETRSCEAKVITKHPTSFHPKVLIIDGDPLSAGTGPGFAIVGSGNLSLGGLRNNIECSLHSEHGGTVRHLRIWFDELFADASRINSRLIKWYEPRHRKARQRSREAQKALKGLPRDLEHVRRVITEQDTKDLRKADAFFYVNTDIKHDVKAHLRMLRKGEASAFLGAKEDIDKIPEKAIVFLYRSSKPHPEIPGKPGIVVFGRATERIRERAYKGEAGETHCMVLKDFHLLDQPITASEISLLRGSRMAFTGTAKKIDAKLGRKLHQEATRRSL